MANPKAPHPTISARAAKRAAALRQVRTVVGWAALVTLGLVYLGFSELRPGLLDFLKLGYLLVLWFFLARTKTLSGQAVAALFAIGLPWAVAVGMITRTLALGPGQLAVDDLGARTALAAVSESSLILGPVLVLVVLAPTRVRGFSVTDWLLAGLVAGLSFQTVEELARLDGGHAGYGLGPLGGGSAALPEAGFAGRPVLTALLGVTIGLAVAGWRHGGKQMLSPAARIAWRALAVLAPMSCWWLIVSVQAGWNATLAVGDRWLTTADPSMPWLLRLGWRLGQHGFGLGWLLLALFLIALLVDAGRLRNAADDADDPLPYPFAPTQAADQWAGRLTRWAGTRTTLPISAAVWLIATSAAVIAYAVRDVVVVLVGFARPAADDGSGRSSAARSVRLAGRVTHRLSGRRSTAEPTRKPGHRLDGGTERTEPSAGVGKQPSAAEGKDSDRPTGRESRWAGIARGCAAGVMVRAIRAEAIALAAGPDTPVTRRLTRAAGAAGLVLVLLAAFWVGPHWATGIGDSVVSGEAGGSAGSTGSTSTAAPTAWLAGALAALGPWWDALALWQYVVLGLGFIALMAFSAGPLDLLAIGGRSVWFTVRSPAGAGSLERVRSYLARSSPTESAVDTVGALLGLLPAGALAGQATGRQVRRAVQEFVTSPLTFIPDRRAAARAATERPAKSATATVRPRGPVDLPPVKLADGRLLSALSADDERLFVATLDDLTTDYTRDAERQTGRDVLRESTRDVVREGRVEAEYRERIYGDDQRLISLRPEKWSDGQNLAYGMVADTAYYDGRGVSWYLPDTLPESIRHKAHLEMDRRLIEFATVVYYPASPFRALEVTTNHPLVAQALEERMSRLAIPGYVVLEP